MNTYTFADCYGKRRFPATDDDHARAIILQRVLNTGVRDLTLWRDTDGAVIYQFGLALFD